MKIQVRDKCASCGATLERRKLLPYLPPRMRYSRDGFPEVVDHPDQKYALGCPYGCGASAFNWKKGGPPPG